MQTHAVTSLLLLIAVITAGVVMAVYYPTMLIWTTYEDLYGEWAQLYFFATTLLLSLWLTFKHGPYRLVFGLLSVACLYVVGEEISWGQRLLGFDSPEFFQRHNLQREANLHNFLVGPYSTVLKDVIEYTLASALVLYGFVYALTLRFAWKPAIWVEAKLRIPAPPLYLGPFFLTAALLEIGLFHLNEAEFAEVLVGSALAIMTAHYLFAGRYGLPIHSPPTWDKPLAQRFSVLIIGIVTLVAGLAFATTSVILDSPEKRAKIEARVLNGYEKYARRYERRGQWAIAASLYLQVHKREPKRTFILRQIAKDYKKLGQNKLFWKYNNKALTIGLKKYKKNPGKISSNLTLARTYRQRGDIEKAKIFGERAHEIAQGRAQKHPDSAHWAYWLGKTAGEINDDELEYEQYRKAFQLKPGSSKYRKAYYRVSRYRKP